MSSDLICQKLHEFFNNLKRHRFPFNEKEIPENGIYVLFENSEKAHGSDRIIRIGTHTGQNQLRSRLKQHFVNENKDRSIFRKNIGRALLNKRKDDFLKFWEIDLTTSNSRKKFSGQINLDRQKQIEKEVSKHIQENFSFVVLPVENKEKRLFLESKIISSVSLCKDCVPSEEWLGRFSPKDKIRKGGLWLVNELWKDKLSGKEFDEFFG